MGYHKVTKYDELSESEEEVYVRDRPSMATAKPKQKSEPYRFEQALLLLFVIQSFCFAVTIAGLIYFYDSSGMWTLLTVHCPSIISQLSNHTLSIQKPFSKYKL